ncbi:MAG: D-alanyl-D-alanine carboxypeptidase/D-alanyl-D-alanine-endopeptidase [Calditrichaeota bacterium]|nr:D-alanyl-D-alanine carboxypeptidase/D-alanyl-D-alanine-endopeptidase [Calditrichota bacterium]
MVNLIFSFLFLFAGNLGILKQVEKYQDTEALKNAQWSVYARYIDGGKEIISHNRDFSLAPASGLKLFTTATALDVLGSDFRFETKLYIDGNLENDRLNGNLIIIAGGDPTLGSDLTQGSQSLDSLMQSWLSEIQKAGIKRITGDIISFTGIFNEQAVPGYWYWIDIGNYYGAGSYSLNINDNLYHLFFKPAQKIGQPAVVLRTKPEIPGLSFDNHMLTGAKGSGDNGYIYCAPKQYLATLRGSIPAGVNEFSIKGSIPDPGLLAAQLVKKTLISNNIVIEGDARTTNETFDFNEKNIIHTTYSPPLKDIVYIINKRSFNLYAETVGKMAAFKLTGVGSTEAAVKTIKHFLEAHHISTDAVDLYDVCGLSPSNTISSVTMTELLAVMFKHPEFQSFYNSMAVAGDKDDEGFFSNWGSGTAMANNARIKSGLINRVRSHSGYVKDKKGRMIVFSLIANNYKGFVKNINNIHKNIIIDLAELE